MKPGKRLEKMMKDNKVSRGQLRKFFGFSLRKIKAMESYTGPLFTDAQLEQLEDLMPPGQVKKLKDETHDERAIRKWCGTVGF